MPFPLDFTAFIQYGRLFHLYLKYGFRFLTVKVFSIFVTE
jgi:hypothetical protein